jgi:hypothetical protein
LGQEIEFSYSNQLQVDFLAIFDVNMPSKVKPQHQYPQSQEPYQKKKLRCDTGF